MLIAEYILYFTWIINLSIITQLTLGCTGTVYKDKTMFTALKYDSVYNKTSILASCSYHTAPCMNHCQLRCLQICNRELGCLFAVIPDNVSCVTCVLNNNTITSLQQFNDSQLTGSNLYMKSDCNSQNDNYGNFDENSYWLYNYSQFPAFSGTYNPNSGIGLYTYNITLNFQTIFKDGIIFFMDSFPGLSNTEVNDFVAGYIKDGYVLHSVDNWSGVGTARTTTTFNDGRWHTVEFYKKHDYVEICVDRACTSGEAISSGGWAAVMPGYHFGGIPSNLSAQANSYLGLSTGFSGVIGNISLNGVSEFPVYRHNMQKCSFGLTDE